MSRSSDAVAREARQWPPQAAQGAEGAQPSAGPRNSEPALILTSEQARSNARISSPETPASPASRAPSSPLFRSKNHPEILGYPNLRQMLGAHTRAPVSAGQNCWQPASAGYCL